ncbi:phytase [Shewanella psychrotolerans]|uniref:phytase n=1 Tax=Shewanella psychrotolerans TaxID=2864206 RepID=UPI001C65F6F7|nr:phytase [Shewanella psychrotolerans]QYK00903.1 phytase [Shewanella psychrotolerans]
MKQQLIMTACLVGAFISANVAPLAYSADQESAVFIEPDGGSELVKWQQHRLFVSENKGLLMAQQQSFKVLMPGQFEYLSVQDNVALTYDTQVDQVQGIRLDLSNVQRLTLLPKRSFQVEWLCLQPRKADQNLYAWIGDDEGRAEQWLLSSNNEWRPQLVRALSVAMGAMKCAVDAREQLYIIDNHQGLWAYPAAPSAPAESELKLYMPDNQLSGLAIVDDQVIMMDEEGTLYDSRGQQVARPFNGLSSLESLYISDGEVWAYSDDEDKFYRAKLSLEMELATEKAELIKEIPTAVESAIADRAGDTMDDPAIWVHPNDPSKSRVIGTNKRSGLLSFSMQGEQLQALPAGRLNNVDIRQRVKLGGQFRDIAVASNRDRNSLSLFEIDKQGQLIQLPEQPTRLTDIYGLCLFQPSDNELYVLANDKSGIISQFALQWQGDSLIATEVKQFSVPSQPEGCVADDKAQRLYVGEEDQGIWMFDLASKKTTERGEMIISVGGPLVADIEGLALYQGRKGVDYLVVSSQGNDSYLLYQGQPPYAYVDRFRIGVNGHKGHDGSAETDGLEVTSRAVGSGVWSLGMMVVQDGRNRLPEQNQNFKWIPWSEIEQRLGLTK